MQKDYEIFVELFEKEHDTFDDGDKSNDDEKVPYHKGNKKNIDLNETIIE